MLTAPTLDNLYRLNLGGMARALVEQRERPDYQQLAFEDRLGLLVDRELQERENRRLERYLKSARLRLNACVEDIDFRHPRGLDRARVLELASAQWVEAHQQVLVVGATGLGKTYLACALAHAAVRHGHTALYLRAPRMLSELATARLDGRLPRLLTSWARIQVLVVDDLGLQPLTNQQAADLLEVIEDRHRLRSTIVTSQLPVAHWHESLGEPTIADAILDRLLDQAHRLELGGRSLRGPEKAGTVDNNDGDTPVDSVMPPEPTTSRRPAGRRAAESPAEVR